MVRQLSSNFRVGALRVLLVRVSAAEPLTEDVGAVVDAALVAQAARPAHHFDPLVNGQLRLSGFFFRTSFHVQALDQFSHVRLQMFASR